MKRRVCLSLVIPCALLALVVISPGVRAGGENPTNDTPAIGADASASAVRVNPVGRQSPDLQGGGMSGYGGGGMSGGMGGAGFGGVSGQQGGGASGQRVIPARQKELLQEELKLIEQEITAVEKQIQTGKALPSDLIPLGRERRQLQSQLLAFDTGPASISRLRDSLAAEIKQVEQKLTDQKKRVEVGAAGQESLLSLERERLRLRRELAALEEKPSTRKAADSAPNSNLAQKQDLLKEEIKLVEHQFALQKAQIEQKNAAVVSAIPLQRELLKLKRELADAEAEAARAAYTYSKAVDDAKGRIAYLDGILSTGVISSGGGGASIGSSMPGVQPGAPSGRMSSARMGGTLSAPSTAQRLTDDSLQAGILEEELNIDLNAAIQSYRSLINQFDGQRALVGNTIFRLGECYRRLGKMDEARAQYSRILWEFSDQAVLVKLSKQFLSPAETVVQDGLPVSLKRAWYGDQVKSGKVDAPAGDSGTVLTTIIFQLRHAQANNVAAILQTLLSAECKLAPDPRTNALIVSGPQNKLEALRQLIQQMDSAVPGSGSTAIRSDANAADYAGIAASVTAARAQAEAKQNLQAKLNYMRHLAEGILMFAEKNNGLMPKDLAQSFSVQASVASPPFPHQTFEVACQGLMQEIKDPSQTILIREREAVRTPDGQWVKCYAFVDAHVEAHVEPSGQFDAWEKPRLKLIKAVKSPGNP